MTYSAFLIRTSLLGERRLRDEERLREEVAHVC
jgi:hypothetical protein